MSGEPEPGPEDFEPEPEPEPEGFKPEPEPEGPELDCVPFVSYQCVTKKKGVVLREKAGHGELAFGAEGGTDGMLKKAIIGTIRATGAHVHYLVSAQLTPATSVCSG